MSFYGPQSIDPSGGMYHYYLDDGTVYDRQTRHLVSAARFVVTCTIASRLRGVDGDGGGDVGGDAGGDVGVHVGVDEYAARAAHALRFIDAGFRDAQSGGYDWMIRWSEGRAAPLDRTRQMYGLAFVMLAAARAHQIGVPGAKAQLGATFALAERHFFDARAGLYADEATADWVVGGYRGQNANMHACEAMIAAFEATGEASYLERAEHLAEAITVRQAALAGGGIWEHYRADWSVDWDYNRDDRSNIYRPWGFQPGHFTEWAKLLCQLDSHLPRPWHLPRAVELFDRALSLAWDSRHGGLCYGFAPDGSICDAAKYHWVQAESLAAAALLARRTGEARFGDWYQRIWSYCWAHFVDHRQGAWFRILTHDNLNLTREKSPAGKVDYHDIGACWDVWRELGSSSEGR
jgi:glucose-6-phosphate isomerase